MISPPQRARWARRRRTPARRRSARRTDARASRRSATRCAGSRSGSERRPAPAARSGDSGSPETTSRHAPARRPSRQRPAQRVGVEDLAAGGVDQDRLRGASAPAGGRRAAAGVSSVNATLTEITSDAASSSSSATFSTPGRRTLRRDQPRTRIPTALPSAATRRPIRPSPITPRVLPDSSAPGNEVNSHPPARVLALACGEPAAEHQHRAERVLGDRRGRGLGDGDHADPARGCRRHVDVRVARGTGRDQPQRRQLLEHVGADPGVGVERDQHRRRLGPADDLVALGAPADSSVRTPARNRPSRDSSPGWQSTTATRCSALTSSSRD